MGADGHWEGPHAKIAVSERVRAGAQYYLIGLSEGGRSP